MSKSCFHAYVSGQVQNVWFRVNTQVQAQSLELTGWVKNLADGRVEVLACGEEKNLKQLQDWLWEGPPGAEVKEVVLENTAWQEFKSFEVIRD